MDNHEINTERHFKVTSSMVTALAMLGPYCTRPAASVQYGPTMARAVTSDSVTLACSSVYVACYYEEVAMLPPACLTGGYRGVAGYYEEVAMSPCLSGWGI